MDRTPLPDLDALDREALLDLIRQQASLTVAYDEEIRRLEAELDAQRQALSEQAEARHTQRAHRASETDGREVPPHDLRQEEREAGPQARTVGV